MRSWAIAVCLSTMLKFAVGQDIDANLLSRIRSEGPDGWTRCETAFQDMSCSVLFTQQQHGKVQLDVRKFEISSAIARSELLVVTFDPQTGQERNRAVINSRYHFSVNAIPGTNRWSLSKGSASEMILTTGSVVRTLRSEALSMLNSVAILGIPLHDFFEEPEHFQMLACKTVDNKAAGSLVQCVFDCRHPYPQFGAHRLVFELIPDKNWMIHRWSKTNLHRGITNEMTHELQLAANGVACLKKATLVRGSPTDGDTTILEFGKPVMNTRESEEFYLPFYGISEASVLPPRVAKDWLRYVMIIAGITLILGGLYLRKKQGRGT